MKRRNTEIECKLVAKEAGVLRQLPLALESICRKVRLLGRQTIVDSYFDTPDWAVFRAGYACRVRCTGAGSNLALKALSRPRKGISVRREYEEALSIQPLRSLNLSPAGPVGRKLRAIIGARRLRRLFTNRNRRTTFEVHFGEKLVAHVSADDFTLSCGKRRLMLAEVELELVKGSLTDLRALARRLAKRMGLSMRHRAKFREGLRLAGLCPPA